jgi:undecaprenyl-diphosphatase
MADSRVTMARAGFGFSWAAYLIAALSLLFTAIAWTVFEGYSAGFDRAAILGLRTMLDPIGAAWLAETARDVTSLGSVAVVFLVVIPFIGYLLLSGRRHSAFLMTGSVVGGLVLNDALKVVFDRPRPGLSLPSVQVFTSSFPSGHAALSSVAYLSMGSLIARCAPMSYVKAYVMAVAVVLVFLIGTTRVYLGVHYPTDVLAGWCLGSAWAVTCWLIARTVEHRQSRDGRPQR